MLEMLIPIPNGSIGGGGRLYYRHKKRQDASHIETCCTVGIYGTSPIDAIDAFHTLGFTDS